MSETKHISGTFLFDPADKIYSEHFPGNPVVPGSLIIDAFIKVLMKNKTDLKTYTVSNFRFKKFISPGEYRFNISRQSSVFFCRLFSSEKTAVTGEITI